VHFSVNGKLYNGRDVNSTFSAAGAKWGSVHAQKNGIFTRGVLLDVAAARGVEWYEKDEYVTVADFEAAETLTDAQIATLQKWSSSTFVEGTAVAAPPAGSSIERAPGGQAGNGTDTNDNAADWLVQAAPSPQGLAAPAVPGPGASPTPTVSPSPTPSATPDPTTTPAPTAAALTTVARHTETNRSRASLFMVTKRLPRSTALFRVEQVVGVGDGPIEFLAGVQSYGDERFDRKSGSHRPE